MKNGGLWCESVKYMICYYKQVKERENERKDIKCNGVLELSMYIDSSHDGAVSVKIKFNSNQSL